ncbi:IS110 family transposase [Aquimarina sp. ERC-38]|uniref:IS110 family transposase n=1 Tax=Aquimarina sp. ERC-38 TaxID=2949996 RepID=UPI002248690E|nr:IS110 family transposase [Aquimarina sp. ERC-38]UZO80417.1 IS110 family transposase [Aquimarina sp. ERC-38]
MKNIFIGIDVSKKNVDISTFKDQTYTSEVVVNKTKELTKFFKQFTNQKVLVAMENTGRYNFPLYEALAGFEFDVYVVHPIHIKRSIGLTRGKNDKIDAKRICSFLQKNYSDLPQWKPNSKLVDEFKILLSERKSLVKREAALKKQVKELKVINSKVINKLITSKGKQIKGLSKNIVEVEKMIVAHLEKDHTLKEDVERIKSIPGVGKVVAWTLLAKTNGFTRLLDPRKLGCFAGVVPFEQQSGTSIKTKPRVSKMADMELKSVLQMSAMRSVRLKDSSLRVYYERKLAEGKNKMSILNAVRNKIIHLALALVNNKTYYKFNLQLS